MIVSDEGCLYAWVCTLPGGARFVPNAEGRFNGQPSIVPLMAGGRDAAEAQRPAAATVAEACRASLTLLRFGEPQVVESYPAPTVPAPDARQ